MGAESPHKKTGYKAQTAWAKRNEYQLFSFRTYGYIKRAIQSLAKEKGVSVSRLICDALEAQYGIDLSKPSDTENPKENEVDP